jgi:5-enolpyruvylshikimate-3-phosphate synthase
MMGGILAINAKSPISIVNSKAIIKSYPNFFQTLNELGIQTEEC